MPWVDYKVLREKLAIAEVAADYGIELRGSGMQRKGLCPAPACAGAEKRTLSVNVDRGLWQCFKCQAKGNVIDLAAYATDLDPQDQRDFRKAALELQTKYRIEPTPPPRQPAKRNPQPRSRKRKVKPEPEPSEVQEPAVLESDPETADAADLELANEPPPKRESIPKRYASAPTARSKERRVVLVNEPLDFDLKNLDPEHELVQALDLDPRTVEAFGIGFCERRGLFQGKVTFPLHDLDAKLVGYAGRDCAEDGQFTGYTYPENERIRRRDNARLQFDRCRLLYGGDRLQGPVPNLIVVSDPYELWHLYEEDIDEVVALLGPATDHQREAIAGLTDEDSTIWFLSCHGDALGSLQQTARERRVRWVPTSDLTTVIRAAHAIS